MEAALASVRAIIAHSPNHGRRHDFEGKGRVGGNWFVSKSSKQITSPPSIA